MSFSILKQHTPMLPVRLGTVAIRIMATKPAAQPATTGKQRSQRPNFPSANNLIGGTGAQGGSTSSIR